ncbi:MAG: hypothetical protein AABY78_07180 [Nitrospirota bacterium]
MKLLKLFILIIVPLLIILLWLYRAYWEWMTFWAAVGAIGSFIVALLAIYGEFFRAWLWGPKLKIIPENLKGDPTTITEL